MTISGDSHRLMLTGSCTQVVVNGNTLSWQKAMKGSTPIQRVTGSSNKEFLCP